METEELTLLKHLHDDFSAQVQTAITQLVTPDGETARPPFNVENVAYLSGQIAAYNYVMQVIEGIASRRKIQFEGAKDD